MVISSNWIKQFSVAILMLRWLLVIFFFLKRVIALSAHNIKEKTLKYKNVNFSHRFHLCKTPTKSFFVQSGLKKNFNNQIFMGISRVIVV